MKDVHCSSKQHMVIKRADYGDFNKNGVFTETGNIDEACSAITNCQVKSLCGGNRSCELTMSSHLLPPEYCPDTSKEIFTEYTCADNINSKTIKGKIDQNIKVQSLYYTESGGCQSFPKSNSSEYSKF